MNKLNSIFLLWLGCGRGSTVCLFLRQICCCKSASWSLEWRRWHGELNGKLFSCACSVYFQILHLWYTSCCLLQSQNDSNLTQALYYAAKEGHYACVKLLLQHGAIPAFEEEVHHTYFCWTPFELHCHRCVCYFKDGNVTLAFVKTNKIRAMIQVSRLVIHLIISNDVNYLIDLGLPTLLTGCYCRW